MEQKIGLKSTMFTGIIEYQAKIASLKWKNEHLLLAIHSPFPSDSVKIGESIALNGVCLTISEILGNDIFFDIQNETLEKTYFRDIKISDMLNIERALSLGDRLSGHIVQGHIDGIGTVISNKQTGPDWILKVGVSESFLPFLVPKGSIAIDGISLTIVQITQQTFTVHIIPHTYSNTNIQFKKRNDKLNLEADILGKYVINYLKNITIK